MDIVEELKHVSQDRGMTLEAVSRELNVSFQTVYRWFKGYHKPHKYLHKAINVFIKRHQNEKTD